MNKILSHLELNFAFFASTRILNGSSRYCHQPHVADGKTEARQGQNYPLKKQQR